MAMAMIQRVISDATAARSRGLPERQKPQQAVNPGPVPHDKWPKWALAIELLKVYGDVGVGDTIERLAGTPGLAFKAAFKAVTGRDCGCDGRKESMNDLYPYLTS